MIYRVQTFHRPMQAFQIVSKIPLILLVLTVCLLHPSASRSVGQPWRDAEIGSPSVTGEHTFTNGTLTITGAGKGDLFDGDRDQLHYTYRPVPAGDIEVVARLVSLEGPPHSRAGILLRADNEPSSTEALVAFYLEDATDSNQRVRNVVRARGRDPAALCARDGNGHVTDLKFPLWLRIVRTGKEFGVYKSQDGKIWSMVANDSGGALTLPGPLEAGFFVAGGDPAQTAVAKFDHVTIGRPNMGYRTSWIGNTFSQNSVGYVSNSISALWVGLDGTCYTNSYYDEAGESAKIYKDGRVVKRFDNDPFGNNEVGEGSITSDGRRMVLASRAGIYRTDMLGRQSATQRIFFATDLWDQQQRINVTSGLALVRGELFVGDSRNHKILVGRMDYWPYYTAGNTSNNVTHHPIDTAGVAHAAPEAVYQSQRECDYLPYRIPGMDPQTVYTVRFHFAEYVEEKPGRRVMRFGAGGQGIRNFDLVTAAGGRFKAVVTDIPNARADASGVLTLTVEREEGGNGHIVICGFEILKRDGSAAFRINCGGSVVGEFQTDVSELPERAFPFPRPGPMTADRRGDLWIIQEANEFPAGRSTATKYPGAIKCYRTDGTFTGKEITDVAHPMAVAYDPTTDRLFVADNGPDQNIRIYADIATAPRWVGSFGVRGGIYAGKTPGRLFDPAAGGWARFYGLNGVGVDAQGSIYVSCGASGTDLRKYTSDGKRIWMLNGLHFVDCADVDPDSDGTRVYNPFKEYTLDYARTQPGSEWMYTAYNWNPFKYGPPPRSNSSSAVIRRVGTKRRLVMYTSGQGTVGYAGIFRFDGATAVPAGRISDNGECEVWTDRNGDGKEAPDEVSSIPRPGAFQSYNVDQKGDIWTVWMGGTPILRRFFFKGLNVRGVPLYGTQPGDYEDIPYPGTGIQISTWGQQARVVYDSDRDVIYLLGPARERKTDKKNTLSYLARYDRWSTGNRKARWLITLPDPDSDPNFMYTSPNPYNLGYQWEAFDVAVDKIFVAELWGPIHVYDAATGKLDIILNAGPEVSGKMAWEDMQMGVRAFKRKNGEYVVFSENSGFRAKNHLFRWKP
jgi:hypothetical protein